MKNYFRYCYMPNFFFQKFVCQRFQSKLRKQRTHLLFDKVQWSSAIIIFSGTISTLHYVRYNPSVFLHDWTKSKVTYSYTIPHQYVCMRSVFFSFFFIKSYICTSVRLTNMINNTLCSTFFLYLWFYGQTLGAIKTIKGCLHI